MKSIFSVQGLRRAPGLAASATPARAVQVLALTFAVSAFSTLGWAGNLVPADSKPSAESADALRIAAEDELAEDGALAPGRRELVEKYATRFGISGQLSAAILHESGEHGIDPDIAYRLVQTESGFERTVVSPAGAIGYAQIKPSTAKWLDPTVSTEDLFERDTNLRLGFRYLALLADDYDQDMRLALLAYNRGPARVRRLIAEGRDPANGYASRILQSRS